jgi:hypothetical protein
MKQIRVAVFLAVVCFAAQSLSAQVSNADTMIRRIFATLKANDQKAFVALYPNRQQFGRFMRNLMEQTFNSEEMKKVMAQDEKAKNLNIDSLIGAQVATLTSEAAFSQMENAFGAMFQSIIKKGEAKGVKWSDATLVSYTIDSSADVADGAPFQPAGMKALKGVIDFTSGGSPYQLAYEKVMYLPTEGGYFGADFPQLARKGESLAPDKEETVTDSVTMTQTETVPPPPPAPKKKPTTKGKTTGSKTPARKPKTMS